MSQPRIAENSTPPCDLPISPEWDAVFLGASRPASWAATKRKYREPLTGKSLEPWLPAARAALPNAIHSAISDFVLASDEALIAARKNSEDLLSHWEKESDAEERISILIKEALSIGLAAECSKSLVESFRQPASRGAASAALSAFAATQLSDPRRSPRSEWVPHFLEKSLWDRSLPAWEPSRQLGAAIRSDIHRSRGAQNLATAISWASRKNSPLESLPDLARRCVELYHSQTSVNPSREFFFGQRVGEALHWSFSSPPASAKPLLDVLSDNLLLGIFSEISAASKSGQVFLTHLLDRAESNAPLRQKIAAIAWLRADKKAIETIESRSPGCSRSGIEPLRGTLSIELNTLFSPRDLQSSHGKWLAKSALQASGETNVDDAARWLQRTAGGFADLVRIQSASMEKTRLRKETTAPDGTPSRNAKQRKRQL